MEHRTFFVDFLHEEVIELNSPANFGRAAHQNVRREWNIDGHSDLRGHFVAGAAIWHNDQQIHIGIHCGRTVRMRSEKDDLVRLELARNMRGHVEDLPSANHASSITQSIKLWGERLF